MRVRNVSYRSESSVIAAGILSSPSSSLLDRDAIFCREILLTDYAYGTRHLRQVATASRNAKAAPTLPVELCSPHESFSRKIILRHATEQGVTCARTTFGRSVTNRASSA